LYGGSLTGTNWVQSVSDSTARGEVLVLPMAYAAGGSYYDRVYASALRRYSHPYLAREADLSLPAVNGLQGYGVEVFHGGQDKQVLLLQVGSDRVGALNVTYHAVWR
jgi:hypothetical protein